MNKFLCIVVVACLVYQVQALTCPCDWEEFDGRCYFISTPPSSWLAARQTCISKGSDLVVPASSETNNFLINAMKSRNAGSSYLGLLRVADDLQKNTFYTIFGNKPSYTNWRPNEPNNSGGDEACALLIAGNDDKWNDVKCWLSFNFVCEISFQR